VTSLETRPSVYSDVIIRRWQEFTGKDATLDGGRTFGELAAERRRDNLIPVSETLLLDRAQTLVAAIST